MARPLTLGLVAVAIAGVILTGFSSSVEAKNKCRQNSRQYNSYNWRQNNQANWRTRGYQNAPALYTAANYGYNPYGMTPYNNSSWMQQMRWRLGF